MTSSFVERQPTMPNRMVELTGSKKPLKITASAIQSKNVPLSQQETGLLQALHSIRTLMCTFTNQTPHEHLFSHDMKLASGVSLDEQPGAHPYVPFCKMKENSLVEKVQLLRCKPKYANLQYSYGREDMMPTHPLTPSGQTSEPWAVDYFNTSEAPVSIVEHRHTPDTTRDSPKELNYCYPFCLDSRYAY